MSESDASSGSGVSYKISPKKPSKDAFSPKKSQFSKASKVFQNNVGSPASPSPNRKMFTSSNLSNFNIDNEEVNNASPS